MVSGSRWIPLVVLSAAFLVGCQEEQVADKSVVRPVRAMKVSDAASLQRRQFPGRAKATRELDLAFKVGGPLISFPVKVGDDVETGQQLGRIDPATFAATMDANVASLERAKATLNNAKLEFDRNNTLFEKGHVSKARLDNVTTIVQRNQADVAAAKAALERARLDLDYTNLRAPFAGIVVRTYVENFENVRAKQPVVRIVDSSRIEMVIDIPESLISLAPHVKEAIVVFDAFPNREVPARIKEIGSEASETTRTYPVTLVMDQPEDVKILPGMAGKASGKAAPQEIIARAGVEVPVSATFSGEEPGSTFVWVIDEQSKTVARRRVSPGNLRTGGFRSPTD